MYNKITLSVLLLVTCTTILTAQVGIGTTDPKAMLDIQSSDNGILIPRVALTETSDQSPIIALTPEIGLLVFNTATVNDVSPGFYYWNGTQWVELSGATTGGDKWDLTGNAGTTAGTNFIGTSDAEDLVIATDGTERMRIIDNAVVVNTPAPLFAGDRFTVQGESGEFAINGYTDNGGAIYGLNNGGPGWGVLGESTNVGIGGYGVFGGVLESFHQDGYGAIISNLTSSGNSRGLYVSGQDLGILNYPFQTASLFYGSDIAITAFTSNPNATGIRGVGNGLTTTVSLAEGAGIAGTGFKFGVFGYATETGINNPNGSFSSAGGYFSNAYGGWAAVGAWGDPIAAGNQADINFKILGTGVVSTVIKDTKEEPVIMFAPETPEILFQDYGIGKLINGKATIKLDPIMVKNIRVDDEHPLKVFIQLEGECNGVFVTNKSINGFDVIELQEGTSDVPFSWSITATRSDEVFTANDGSVRISKNGVRFPNAPKFLDLNIQNVKSHNEEEVNSKTSENKDLLKSKKEKK